MNELEDFEEESSGTIFRDDIMLALIGFVAMVVMLLPHLRKSEVEAQDHLLSNVGSKVGGEHLVHARPIRALNVGVVECGVGTVVAGTTLAFMAITYPLIGLIFRRELMFPKLAQWQPYLFGIGVAGISLFMMGAGTLGVSRRHWDMNFTDATLSFDYPATAFLMMGLNGLFAILAALGGLVFVIVVVASVFFGAKKGEAAPAAQPEPVAAPSGAAVALPGRRRATHSHQHRLRLQRPSWRLY